jgi:WD40 repeat protein
MTLSTGDGGGLKAWNVGDGTEIAAFNQSGQLSLTLGDIVWSKDGSHILVSGINGEAYIADAKTGVKVLTIQNDSWIWGAYWSPDESKIMGLLPNNRVLFIWDSATGTPLQTLRHQYFVTNAAWSADGNRVLTSSSNSHNQSAVDIWDAVAGYHVLNIGESIRSSSAAWDVSNKFVLGWFTDPFQVDGLGTWKVWDASNETELLSGAQTGGVGGLLSPLWSPTESRLLTRRGGEIRIWQF